MLLLQWVQELKAPGWPCPAGQAASPATAPLMPENGGILALREKRCHHRGRGRRKDDGWSPLRDTHHSAPTPALPTSSRFALLPGPGSRGPGAASHQHCFQSAQPDCGRDLDTKLLGVCFCLSPSGGCKRAYPGSPRGEGSISTIFAKAETEDPGVQGAQGCRAHRAR